MIAPAVALALGGAAAGAFGGMKSAKQSKKPTITTISRQPSAQLGGYQRILDAMNRARDTQGYQIGQNNPYLNPVMSHIMGRAGVQIPEGGWRQPPPPSANPYLTPQTPQGPGAGLDPATIEEIRKMMDERRAAGTPINPPPGTHGPGSGGGM